MIVTYDTDQLPYFMVYVCNGLVIIFWQKKIYRFFDQNCSLIASFIFYTMVGKFVWKSSLSQNCRLFEFFLGCKFVRKVFLLYQQKLIQLVHLTHIMLWAIALISICMSVCVSTLSVKFFSSQNQLGK